MADSPEKILLDKVAQMLAGLSAFQAFCGVTEEDDAGAAAAARVHVEAVRGVDFEAPGALVQLWDATDRRRSYGTTWSYWPGGMVCVELRGLLTLEAEGETNYADAWLDFMEAARAVKWALADAGAAAGGVQFMRHREMPGPELLKEEQWQALADGALGEFVVVWGFTFELAEAG
jgi:hypothetical protein